MGAFVKILSLGDRHDDANAALKYGEFPIGARLQRIGTKFYDFDIDMLRLEITEVFFAHIRCAASPRGAPGCATLPPVE